ncbi:hypothetical protein PR202_gb13281 [Eleusine coracana subsp. coracana]|uniref:Uncharacterized protein n=1 Tax=Eleusine coracana subsp. coracana TaxID=191504 RepID=A0AAV5EPX9_ELECO|nr:hypothetical protein PR202_gb13281 [Eleusine coracana subsp. coracana]
MDPPATGAPPPSSSLAWLTVDHPLRSAAFLAAQRLKLRHPPPTSLLLRPRHPQWRRRCSSRATLPSRSLSSPPPSRISSSPPPPTSPPPPPLSASATRSSASSRSSSRCPSRSSPSPPLQPTSSRSSPSPPLLLLLPLPFIPPLLLRRPLLLSLPLLLLARAASLLAASFPPSDLQQHALSVAGVLLLAGAAASLASSLAAPRTPAHLAAEAALACAGAVGALWAAQAGLSLYVDACVPAGCHRLIDASVAPATRCDVDDARLRAVAVMDLALSVHCVVVAAVAAGVCLAVARWCGVDSGAVTGTGRRHNGSSYDALPSVVSPGAMAEMEHLPVKNVVGKSVAQE